MSFDFSTLPTKATFESENPDPAPVTPPTEQEIYDNRLANVQRRVINFFSRTGGVGNNKSLKIRTGFLTSGDKSALVSAVEGKGFSCVEDGNLMTIE